MRAGLLVMLVGVVFAVPAPAGATSVPTDLPSDAVLASTTSSGFVPVIPTREVDTRRGHGGGVLRAGERRVVPLGSLPSDASGVVVNLTATDASAPGYLVVDDCSSRWATSALNLAPGRAVANQVVAGVASEGRQAICVRASADTHVIVDLIGVMRPDGAMLRPTSGRVHDSRTQGGFGADDVLRVDLGPVVTGRSGVIAWTGTVTATDVSSHGYVTVWPCASRRPGISQLNLTPGITTANQVTVALPADDPTLCLRRVGSGQLIVDSTGVWTQPSTRAVRTMSPPRRVVDTRSGSPVQPGEIRRVHGAVDGVLMLNLTATRSAGDGWIALFECGAGHLGTSTANLIPGTDVAAAATVAAGSGGVCVIASARTDVVVDVFAVQQRAGVTGIPDPGVPGVGVTLGTGDEVSAGSPVGGGGSSGGDPGAGSSAGSPVGGGGSSGGDPGAGSGSGAAAPTGPTCWSGPLDQVNAARRTAGLAPLVSDARTDSFACHWAIEMASLGRMVHSTPAQRTDVDRCGVTAENIARGTRGWEWMFDAWMESPPHRANLLHPLLTRASFVYVNVVEDGRPVWYGTITFGGAC